MDGAHLQKFRQEKQPLWKNLSDLFETCKPFLTFFIRMVHHIEKQTVTSYAEKQVALWVHDRCVITLA